MQVTLIIVAIFVVIALVYSREQYTTYPSTNERRLNTIKQLADDVIRDLRKIAPQQTYYTQNTVQPTYTYPNTVQPTYTYPNAVQPTYPQATTRPASQASIPTWVRNLTSTAAVQQLRLINPGYTVRRLPMGSAITRDFQANRITVVYDPSSDRVISASQG